MDIFVVWTCWDHTKFQRPFRYGRVNVPCAICSFCTGQRALVLKTFAFTQRTQRNNFVLSAGVEVQCARTVQPLHTSDLRRFSGLLHLTPTAKGTNVVRMHRPWDKRKLDLASINRSFSITLKYCWHFCCCIITNYSNKSGIFIAATSIIVITLSLPS